MQNTPQTYKRTRFDKHVRQFILKSIAAYKTDEWIVNQIHERFGIAAAIDTIRINYRHNHQYKEQISKYRDRYNQTASEHPLYSKHYVLDLLTECIKDAKENKDYKGVKALVSQANKITGMEAPESIEVNHTVSGGMGYEATLKMLLQSGGQAVGMIEGEVIEAEALPLLPSGDDSEELAND